MKITTHLVCLRQCTADELLRAQDPWHRFPTCPALAITPADLSALGERLGLGSRDALLPHFSLLAGESQHPPWVISLPARLLRAIGSLEDAQLEALDSDWVHADRGQPRPHPAEVSAFLASASRFIGEHGAGLVLYVVDAPGTV